MKRKKDNANVDLLHSRFLLNFSSDVGFSVVMGEKWKLLLSYDEIP